MIAAMDEFKPAKPRLPKLPRGTKIKMLPSEGVPNTSPEALEVVLRWLMPPPEKKKEP